MKTLRSLMAKNLITRRRLSKQLRDYSNCLSKRRIRSIFYDTQYLEILIEDNKKLKYEYDFLFKSMIELKISNER